MSRNNHQTFYSRIMVTHYDEEHDRLRPRGNPHQRPVPDPGAAEGERPRYVCIEKAQVTMVAAEISELDWYVSSGEPMDKAGSYALQAMGAALVESVRGDPTTVIGLPLRSSIRLLRLAGVRWP